MAAASLTITGDKALMAQFDALSEAVRGRAMLRAVIAGGLLVANDAKARAAYKTGNLRRSIHVGGEGVQAASTGSDIGGQEVGADFAEVKVGTNVEYARRIELGFAGADSLGRIYDQPARPYLRPALESQRGAAEREIGDALRDLIRAAV